MSALFRHHWLEAIYLKNLNWTPAFAGVTIVGEAWVSIVIPAEAGIQDKEKTKSVCRSLWPY
jgi:hypothetical protein